MEKQNGNEHTFENHECDIINQVIKSEGFVDYSFVTSAASAKGENFLGVIEKVKVNGKKNKGDKDNESLNLIVKTPPKNVRLREEAPINRFYSREVFAYKTLLPTLQKLHKENSSESKALTLAKCYESSSEDLKEILVFDDLLARGFVMYGRLKPLDYEHIIFIIKTLAKFHALSFAAKEKCSDLYENKDIFYGVKDVNYDMFKIIMEANTDKVIDMLEDPDHKAKAKRVGYSALEIFQSCYDIKISHENLPYSIICHGDCWINNFLFKYEEGTLVDMVMLDWQIVKIASPVTDIVYLIYTCTDEDLRHQHLDEIYDTYYATLGAELSALGCDVKKCYPEPVFRKDIKEKSIVGLLWAFMLIPLVLSSKEEAVDMDDLFDGDKIFGDGIKISTRCKKRLRGVVKDFVDSGMI